MQPDDPATTRPSPLRRLSRRYGWWRLRYAANEALERSIYAIGKLYWPVVAPLYRPLLRATTFIAVTGSCGKSTTRSLIASICGGDESHRGIKRGINLPVDNAHAIWRMPRSMRHAAFEIGVAKEGQRGTVRRSARLIQPRIAVVTNIGDDHISAFGSREAIALEKGDLVEMLPRDGVAVLNADDPLVMSMAERCRGRVLTYGTGEQAMLRATDVSSRWPATLSFTVVAGDRRARVQTQLCGEHFVHTALAAIAGAVAAGIPLEEAARSIRDLPPFFARMEPQTRDDGVTFIRDDVKAPLWTLPATFAFLAGANAPRKIIALGTISDYTGESRRVYLNAARQALAVADHVLFVGPHAPKVLKARRSPDDEALQAFSTLRAAHDYLSGLLRQGDLVLLKGSQNDLLYQLALERFPGAPLQPRVPARPEAAARDDAPDFAIVGLGNPESRFDGTRHNVGRACVERLAERLAATWVHGDLASVAQIRSGERSLRLVLLKAAMNDTGPALKRLCDAWGVAPTRCLLVHDDVDLAAGRVRGRIDGGGGGHRGIRSVLETFEDHRFPRVKIGIGRPAAGTTLADHVLQPFGPHEQPLVDASLNAGADQVMLLLSEIEARERREAAAGASRPPAIAA